MNSRIKNGWRLLGLFIFCLVHFSAYAATVADLSYSISDGEATITDCASSASGELIIPSAIEGYPVTAIGLSAFNQCNALTRIDIPGSVTKIDSHAFYSCDSLTNIVIPDSVTEIGHSIFQYCVSLTNAVIGNSITDIGRLTFNRCDTLETVHIPDSVTSIGSSTFDTCRNLRNITLPDSVTQIGARAFFECDSLSKITIPDNVITIGNAAYEGCDSLTNIIIGSGVETIEPYAFNSCALLTNMIIPDNVITIGHRAFPDTSIDFYVEDGLRYVFSGAAAYLVDGSAATGDLVPPSVVNGLPVRSLSFYTARLTGITIPHSVTVIGADAFRECESLRTVVIPDSVTSIGSGAFNGCTALQSVTLPGSVTLIGYRAFRWCESLTQVVIPEGVTEIAGSTFYYCTALSSVDIPDSVSSIGQGAFEDCESLTSVTIPGNVTYIGSSAFEGCTALTNASFIGDAPGYFGNYVFDSETSRDFKIYYREGAADFTTPTWNGYPSIMLSDFEAWALAAPEGERGAADKPADDGIPNLIKYAVGLDPETVHTTDNLFSYKTQTNLNGPELVLTYYKDPSTANVNIYAATADNLTNGISDWSTNGISSSVTGEINAKGFTEWRAVLPCENQSSFLRLQAEVSE